MTEIIRFFLFFPKLLMVVAKRIDLASLSKKNRKLATQSTDFGRARAGSCSRKGRERSRLGRVVLGPVWGFRGGAARVLEMLIPAVVWFGEK